MDGNTVISSISTLGITVPKTLHQGHQYGFFPAYSAAWNIAEPIIKNIEMDEYVQTPLFIWQVGNDVVGDNDQRFPIYLPSVPVGDLIMQTSDKI